MVSTVKFVMQGRFKYSAFRSKQGGEGRLGGGWVKEFVNEEERRKGGGACGGQMRQEEAGGGRRRQQGGAVCL